MKICILTQPLGANYGGILQAYALQMVLRDMGHDVTTLRFHPSTPWVPTGIRKYALTLRRFVSKYLKGNKNIVCCNPDKQTKFAYRELDRFIDEHMQCRGAHAPLSHQLASDYDAFIVGSDQVWRPAYSPCLPNFYLDFLGGTSTKRIAYAASFGVDNWETDESTTIQLFDAISVRESSAVGLCQTYLGVKAALMPDPTILLQATDYYDLCGAQLTPEDDYIAVYMLDIGEREQLLVDQISAQTGLPIKTIGRLDWTRNTDSVESWLSGIAGARFVVTNSFHGTVFSLLFEKDFLSIKNSQRGASRFSSLLNSVGLLDRLLDISASIVDVSLLPEINYQVVKDKLNSMRQQGRSFLQDNLQ